MILSRGRGRFGLLVPFTNTNMEPDFDLMRPDGVSLHVARLGGYDADAIPDETQMGDLGASDIDEPLRLLAGVRPDVVFYGCTSATLVHGVAFDRDLSRRIAADIGAQTVTAAGALVFALKTLGVKKFGFASPYVPAINDTAVAFLNSAGFACVHRSEVAETLDNDGQGAMTPKDVYALGQRADHADADAIILSCTDMRAVEIIDALEQDVGKPVITSNQAMMAEARAMLGVSDPVVGYGRLMHGGAA